MTDAPVVPPYRIFKDFFGLRTLVNQKEIDDWNIKKTLQLRRTEKEIKEWIEKTSAKRAKPVPTPQSSP